jgi:hypothetical protein
VRVTVELMATDAADLKLLEQHDPLIRDAIIRLIGSKTGAQIKSLVNRAPNQLVLVRPILRQLRARTRCAFGLGSVTCGAEMGLCGILSTFISYLDSFHGKHTQCGMASRTVQH